MKYIVQFRRVRRGVSEVIHTLPVAAADASGALARATNLAETRFWPPGTDTLRVMDEGGRTVVDWVVPRESV
jgi:hypothetical protein